MVAACLALGLAVLGTGPGFAYTARHVRGLVTTVDSGSVAPKRAEIVTSYRARSIGTRADTGAVAELDTVAVYGPVQFSTPTGSAAMHVERFTVAASPGRRYVVRAENGAPDGSLAATGVTVALNGSPVLTQADFGGAHVASRTAAVLSTDTLQVTVEGVAGAYATVSVLTVPDPTFTVYGERTFIRPSGASPLVTDTFTIPATAAPPYLFYLTNGLPDGTRRASSATVLLNGVDVLGTSEVNQQVGGFVKQVALQATNTVEVQVESAPGNQITLRFAATDTTPPTIAISAPQAGLITRDTLLEVGGTVQDETATGVTVNGVAASMNGSAFSATVPLATEGENPIVISAVDGAGHRTDSTRTVIRDTEAPVLAVSAPTDGAVTKAATATVSGTVSDQTTTTVAVNGVPLGLDTGGGFSGAVALNEGANFLTVLATDAAGNSASVVRSVTRDTVPPVLTVSEPADGATTDADHVAVSGRVIDATAVTVTINGSAVVIGSGGAFSGDVALVAGANNVTVAATDAAGNTATVTRTVTRQSSQPAGGLIEDFPIDTTIGAPAVDPTVVTTLGAASEFLYTGPNAIQTGVAPGTIEPLHVAVLRGRVRTHDGQPLAGVTVTVLDHPEFGATVTRDNGLFDMAVNGGTNFVLRYAKDGFLTIQRPVPTRWQDYSAADDVVMVPLDPQVTTIDFSEPMEVARGSVVSDSAGARQATLLFPQGTGVSVDLPDGTTRTLSTINVRATEYTVGPSGHDAMPAPLPTFSAYTYAAELSVDEAIAAGATAVHFTKTVPFYVENFLRFPVGIPVPVGYYDRINAGWVASNNGRVVKLLGVTAGLADLDVDGTGTVADSAALAAMGITDAERAQVAQLYQPGETLWRLPLTHFSPLDGNFPAGPAGGGGPPDVPPPSDEQETQKQAAEQPDKKCGSIIECQTQVLGERIPVVGTPFSLNYRSSRVPGYSAVRTLDIPLSGATVPDSLKRIELEIDVAGRQFHKAFPAEPNQQFHFVWDGLDAYGRPVVGARPATVRVGYVYNGYYFIPADDAQSFGLPCQAPPDATGTEVCLLPSEDTTGTASPFREITKSQEMRTTLGGFGGTEVQALGSWTLDVQHAYDPLNQVILFGDGTHVDGKANRNIHSVVSTVAGNGIEGFGGDGGPGTSARLDFPTGIAVGADGSVYWTDFFGSRVRKLDPNGIVSTVAGNGIEGFGGDGGPATDAELDSPAGLALGPDGSLYITEQGNNRVRRVSPGGIITTFAGSGPEGGQEGAFAGDGGPATEAKLDAPVGVTVAPDGSVFIADWANNRIRKVDVNGIITTVAGSGPSGIFSSGFGGDGGPATSAQLCAAADVVIGPDGSLYIADACNSRIRRVGRDGMIGTVAGGSPTDELGDGREAIEASLSDPTSIAIGPDGGLYIADRLDQRIRRVGADGIITTIAGSGPANTFGGAFGGDGGPATAARFDQPISIAFGPDGSLYVADVNNQRIRRLTPAFPGLTGTNVTVVNDAGTEAYVFSEDGRHLQTLDALTGVLRYQFAYDTVGRLTSITDGNGNVTTIERSANGVPTAIVAPFGQRTMLALAANGFLSTVVDPANDTTALHYASGGLLTSLTDPLHRVHTFTYDSLGLLTKDEDPAGGSYTLARSKDSTGFNVTVTNALGQSTTYGIGKLPSGEFQRQSVDSRQLTSHTSIGTDGSLSTTYPNGTTISLLSGPDPRLGMQAPLPKQFTITMPSGLTFTQAMARHVVQADSADPLSVARQTDSLVTNGRVRITTFDAVQHTVTAVSPTGRTATGVLDERGRLLEEHVPGIAPITRSYDARGRLFAIAQGSRTEHFDYNSNGLLASVTDPLSRVDSLFYDKAGRLTRRVLFDGRQVLYSYDQNGNLLSLTPPGRPAHTFEYTPTGLIAAYSPPAVDGAGLTRYGYDLARRLTQITRPDSSTIEVAYDSAGRRSSLSFAQGQITLRYDSITGNLVGITAPGGSALAYDYDGTLLTRMASVGEINGQSSFTYDNDLRLRSIAVNGTDTVGYQYDPDGLPITAGALTIARDAGNGLVTGTVLGSVATTTAHDTYAQDSTFNAVFGPNELYHATYVHDAAGRITALTETVDGQATAYGYGYDAVGRLTTVSRNGAVVTSYEYDANGNRARVTGAGGVLAGTYDVQDRQLSYGGETYTYTANGELRQRISGDTTRYSYNTLGSLTAVDLPDGNRIEYLIDGRGRRIGRKLNGVLLQGFLYGGAMNPVAELDGSGQVVSRFVYATRPDVPDYMVKGGVTYRLVTDHLGSVRLVVNVATGDVAQRLDYDEFGQVTQNSNPGFQPFGFAGGLYDQDTKLVHFGAREYDPHTGRWTSKDPIGLAGGDPNLYGYALNDPVNLKDPNGKFGLVGALVGALLGGTVDALEAGLCGGDAGDVLKAFGKGALIGGVSGLFGSVIGEIAGDVAVGSAVAGAAEEILSAKRGELTGSKIGEAAVLGGIASGVAERLPTPEVLDGHEKLAGAIKERGADEGIDAIRRTAAGAKLCGCKQ